MNLIESITDPIRTKLDKPTMSQKYFSVAAMFQDLSDDLIEMNLRKDIDKLL